MRKQSAGGTAQQGFLLIEVLFAAALLALVIAVIAGSFSSSYRALGTSRTSAQASLVLQSKLTTLRDEGVDTPQSGQFDDAGDEFTWRAEPAGDCADDLCPVTVIVEWQARGRIRDVRATTLLPGQRATAAKETLP